MTLVYVLIFRKSYFTNEDTGSIDIHHILFDFLTEIISLLSIQLRDEEMGL